MTRGPDDSASLTERLRARAREDGLELFGVARASPSEHMDFFRSWIAAGRHGEMAYLGRPEAIDRRADLTTTLASVRSVVVVGDEYYARDAPDVVADRSRGVIARYARGADYHRVLKRKLLRLHRWLDDEVEGGVEARAYVDTGPILERELARRAGVGWFGRNTMLIHPRRGSYFFLGLLLVNVDLARETEPVADRCGTCRACLDACPTGALLGRDENGAPRIDARRCISYLTIELEGPIPPELRRAMGNRVFGCDICQEVCPFNERFARPATEPGYGARGPGRRPHGVEPLPGEHEVDASASIPHSGTDAPSLIELLEAALDQSRWESLSRGSSIRRAGRAGFARNVCVALGNWGDARAVPVLGAALADVAPLVRAHAAWALGMIASVGARAVLTHRLDVETADAVVEEISEALLR